MDEISVKSDEIYKGATVEIYDYTGQQILSEELLNNQQTFDLKGLNTGIYYIRLISEEKTRTKKFIKL
jgi:hypothetical protein